MHSESAPQGAPATAPELLAQRYGAPRGPGRRTVILLTGALAAVAVAFGAWVAVSHVTASVTTQEVGFQIAADDSSVAVTFDITMPRDAVARCTLEALDARYAQVGLLDVEVGPFTQRVNRVTASVATSAPPVTAIVRSCRLAP